MNASGSKYFQQGFLHGIGQRPEAVKHSTAPAPTAPAPAPTPQPEQPGAPTLDAPKAFDGTRSEYGDFILQLHLIFHLDPAEYTNSDATKISYASSYLSGPAKEWFCQVTDKISFQIWAQFVAALKAAFDDPDAYQTAERKIRALKQGPRHCSAYHEEFVPLAVILQWGNRLEINYFHQGLNRRLREALSNQLELPSTFDAYVQVAIKLDNNFRALRTYRTAARKIEALKQGPRPCSAYYAEFVPLAAILQWGDGLEISYFHQGLNCRLQEALSYQLELPSTFDAYVQVATKLDNNLRALRKQHN